MEIKAEEKKKEKEKDPAAVDKTKEVSQGMTTWICPRCLTHYIGWSDLNACTKCGYRE